MTFLASLPLAGITEQGAQLGLHSGHSGAIRKVMGRVLLLLFSLSHPILAVFALDTRQGCWVLLLAFSWLFWGCLHLCGQSNIEILEELGAVPLVLMVALMPGPAFLQTFRNIEIQ